MVSTMIALGSVTLPISSSITVGNVFPFLTRILAGVTNAVIALSLSVGVVPSTPRP